MKVYVAFADSYEHRHVVGVFKSPKRAAATSELENLKLTELSRGPMPDVEEWEVDDLCEGGCGDQAGHVAHDLCSP